MTIEKVFLIYFFMMSPFIILAFYFFYKAFFIWYKSYREESLKPLKERKMDSNKVPNYLEDDAAALGLMKKFPLPSPVVMTLPFNQDPSTIRVFELPSFHIYVNRARTREEREGQIPPPGGRLWISHKTKPKGIYSVVPNTRGAFSFVHRITARIRNASGVDYLQLIFFSWWVAVVRKDVGQFSLKGEPDER